MTAVVVAGAVANKAGSGGESWVRISWARALAQLGFDVHLVEQISPGLCGDGLTPPGAPQASPVAYFRQVARDFGLDGRASLLTDDGDRLVGLAEAELAELAAEAALLVNISGHLRRQPLLDRFRRRAYVDIDPGFTQVWHAHGAALGLEEHHLFLTIGESIGQPGCPIPTNGLAWRPVRQPVVLDDWPVVAPVRPETFTTVASWRGGYGPLDHDGRTYGLKVHEFRRFVELPRRVPLQLEIALDIHPADHADRRLLLEHGWALADPRAAAGDPDAFRRYVQASAGELSVAQGVYVETASGWFSDRTVRYLASGRPAVVQDTGFTHRLPTGEGLLAFSTIEEAVACVEAVAADWHRHARAARAVAERCFSPAVALAPLLEAADIWP